MLGFGTLGKSFVSQGATGPDPVFSAPLVSSLVATGDGTTTPNFSRSGVATVKDYRGRVIEAQVDEARFQGARRIENIIRRQTSEPPMSEDMRSANVVVSSTVTSATMVNFAGPSTACIMWNGLNIPDNARVILSVEAKSADPTDGFRFQVNNSGSIQRSPDKIITSSYVRYASGVINSGTNDDLAGLCNLSAGGLMSIDFRNFQVEIVGGEDGGLPAEEVGDYVSVGVESAPWHGANLDGIKYFENTNPWVTFLNVAVDLGTSTELTTLEGFLTEATRSQLHTRSSEMSTTPWVRNPHLSLEDTGLRSPDGKYAGVSFTNAGTGGTNQGSFQGSALTLLPSTRYTFSVFTKNYTSTKTLVGIWKNDPPTGYYNVGFDWVAGVPTNIVVSTGSFLVSNVRITEFEHDWWRVEGSFLTGASSGSNIYIPIIIPEDDVDEATTAAFWGFNIVEEFCASSYMETLGTVPVSRGGDFLHYDSASHIANEGSVSLRYSTHGDSKITLPGLWGRNWLGFGAYVAEPTDTYAMSGSGGAGNSNLPMSPYNTDALIQMGGSWSVSDLDVEASYNYAWKGSKASITSIDTGNFGIGRQYQLLYQVTGTIRDFKLWDVEGQT